ncbi:hypothetical protein CYMTET_54407 [Cymbomonas tetramitiformis]|uniref:Uncharacterized protein n=1 Tax=Cymbomonas tetramitiformis TaxID=36881 RepID=A0AAE0BEZ9_9CHLO|nr:hypothetical protein CYMTET_54407 [Cymbomonas tetramitiformis]
MSGPPVALFDAALLRHVSDAGSWRQRRLMPGSLRTCLGCFLAVCSFLATFQAGSPARSMPGFSAHVFDAVSAALQPDAVSSWQDVFRRAPAMQFDAALRADGTEAAPAASQSMPLPAARSLMQAGTPALLFRGIAA